MKLNERCYSIEHADDDRYLVCSLTTYDVASTLYRTWPKKTNFSQIVRYFNK